MNYLVGNGGLEALETMLGTGAVELGIKLTPDQRELFLQYHRLLQRWNRAYNLTSVAAAREIVSRHFLDSLAYNCFLPAAGGGRILDIGSGAGFPGLPLAIIRATDHFILVEAKRKKVFFLQQVIRQLRLANVTIIHLHLQRGNARNVLGMLATAIVTRAVAGSEVLPAVENVLIPGGSLVLSATAGNREEFHWLLATAGNWRLVREKEIKIPFLERKRYLLQAAMVENQGSNW